MIYKLGPELFIADWQSGHNHMDNKDEEICDMDVRVDARQMSMNPSMHVNCTNTAGDCTR